MLTIEALPTAHRAEAIQSASLRPETVDEELRSLFALLDDPDERIARAVTKRIVERGREAILPLRAFAKRADNTLARTRAERIAAEFSSTSLTSEFEELAKQFATGSSAAFERGLLLIARYGNPSLDAEAVRSELDQLAEQLRSRLRDVSSALELLDTINRFFFDEFQFRGNQVSFLDPDNSYLDRVLDRRTGIPISLAAVYLLITRNRLGLPFSGVSAPGHFLVRYDGLSEPLFIDAFNSGVILRERDIKHYLENSGLPYHRQFLDPAPPRAILLRMLRNLVMVFSDRGNKSARAAMERFMRALAPTGQATNFLRGMEER
jgi:regulator of sirC expression with transglutaminase-like and TPR domain